jgi:hypothetical protein
MRCHRIASAAAAWAFVFRSPAAPSITISGDSSSTDPIRERTPRRGRTGNSPAHRCRANPDAMIRLALKLALAGVALWAVWSFVPLRGRTLADRWRAAPDAVAFAERGWTELAGLAKGAPKPQARQKPTPAQRPTEGHTEADRRAVDRILSDRLDGRP